MGGKSTYLRQTALLCLMAQAGSFVPAREREAAGRRSHLRARRRLGQHRARPVDVHGRDAGDREHPAHARRRAAWSILDEIGRGTATFDGLSLAWAVAEHLASNPTRAPKTIFATHYHELTDLADALPGVVNFHVVVREWKDDIVFLRKIVPGRSDRSYGIQVARLAGLPPAVVDRAPRDPRPASSATSCRAAAVRRSAAHRPHRAAQLGLFQAPAAERRRAASPAARDRHQRADADASACRCSPS